MPSFVHIFVGKEFSNLIEGVGRAAHKYSGGTTASDISYLKVDYSGNNLNISRLVITPTTEDPTLACLDRYLEASWEAMESAPGAIATKEFKSVWENLYNELFTINNGGTYVGLTVFIHFPLYKAEAYEVFEHLYSAIGNLNRPTRVNFMGYFDDISKILEPSYKIKSPSKNQIARYRKFREEQNMDLGSMLVALQNTTYNGVSLGLNEEGLKEVVAQFVVAASMFYQDLFPPTLAYKDVVAFGVASLQVDKYMLVDYLMNRAFCNAMDVASVNGTEVDVNDALDAADRMLIDKRKLLSNLFASKTTDDAEAKEHFRKEVTAVMTTCEEIFKREKSITKKAAILAALLSKTDCPLFAESIYNENSASIRDLFAEGLNYFIENDYGHYFVYDGKPLFNPIDDLKKLDAKIINSENEIRRLSAEIDELSKQIADAENVERCFFDVDNGVFHFNDNEFRIQPDNIEPEILEETFVPVSTTSLPESVDLRSRFNPIRNQGQQGSCVAFALTSIYEYTINRKTKELLDLSEAFLYYNARDIDPNDDVDVTTDIGSRSNCAIKSLSDFGLPLESKCPYNDKVYDQRPSDEAYEDAKQRLLIKALNVERKADIFKAALAEGYPIQGGFLLCESFFTKASIDGYVPMPTESEVSAAINPAEGEARRHGRHEMAIVGYSDKLQCFIVRNSWGDSWGDAGHCYLPYAYVDDQRMMDFAAIITDVKTAGGDTVAPKVVDTDKVNTDGKEGDTPQYDVPTLTMDDGDIRMRYYINQALLAKEGVALKEFYSQRSKLLKEFETMTNALASKPSSRDEYITAALNTLEAEDKELRTEKRQIEETMEEEAKIMKKYNLKMLLYFVGISALILLTFYFLPLCNLWSLVFIAPLFIFFSFRTYRRWKEYREDVNTSRLRIKKIDTRLAELRDIISQFKFKTFAAWHLLREVSTLQSNFSSLYTKYLSLINNLRAWYIEVQHKNDDVTLGKDTPNISLLDNTLADRLFDEILRNDKVSEIDFTSNIDSYSLAENYIVEYKKALIDMVAEKLLSHPTIADFSLTDHIVGNPLIWVRDVDKTLTNECERKSNIFVHLSAVANSNVQRTEYLITAHAKSNDSRLGRKFPMYSCALEWNNAHMLSYISIMTLRFEDCELAQ